MTEASWPAWAALQAASAARWAGVFDCVSAASEAADAAMYEWAAARLDERSGRGRAKLAAKWAAEGMAMDGAVAERAWQVRHFVHAMECVKLGKTWPKIKETP
jgi:hypothetical protein